MSADTQVAELEQEVHFLMEEVERYRSAAEDALQQLDWCIGYFAGSHEGRPGPLAQREQVAHPDQVPAARRAVDALVEALVRVLVEVVRSDSS